MRMYLWSFFVWKTDNIEPDALTSQCYHFIYAFKIIIGKYHETFQVHLRYWRSSSFTEDFVPYVYCRARDAVKAIRKRLQQNVGKNYTIVMYTLTVSVTVLIVFDLRLS